MKFLWFKEQKPVPPVKDPSMRTANRSGRTWPEDLDAFLMGMQKAHPSLKWERVVIWESIERVGGVRGRRGPHDPESFAPRFQEILDEVDRSWVNLSAETVRDGALIVEVIWFAPGPDGLNGYVKPDGSKLPVTVNYSGMSRRELEALGVPWDEHKNK